MTVTITETQGGKILQVQATGKLSKEDYEKFVPLTEEKIGHFGKIRILFIMHDFHGWDAGALWDDIKFDAKHFNQIERLAIVGESKWEHGMSAFCRPFTTASIKYFDQADIAQAREWVQAPA